MQVGSVEVHVLSDGRFWLDGGAMYGAVPRPLWEKQSPPDARHRIEMELYCTLIKTPGARILVDAGIGPQVSERDQERWSLQRQVPLLEQLDRVGVRPEDVTHVVLTHLHFDHAGGAGPTLFPQARHVIQRREWDAAQSRHPRAMASYPEATLAPLRRATLQLVDGDHELVPGVRVLPTGGHSRGHQVALVESDGEGLLCWGDLMPLSPYARPGWVCGYDVDPEGSVTQKQVLARKAVERGWRIVTSHDPHIPVGTLERVRDGFAMRAYSAVAID